ncbi:MAG: trypsin-like peptidase domain-containing protein, partial [Phoenicibacter congonensis]|nr:trypsin-like peptidase domain-containing protein [Phoenicibacter congonensis]
MNQENKNTTQANETTESKNQTFASESNAESTKNLTVSLPMQTSTSNAQNTHRLDAIRSVHKEQKTIKEETVNANSSNINEAPVTGNEKVSNFKPTNSKETQNPNSPNIGTGVPPTYNSAANSSAVACKKDKKQLASMFGIGFLGALLACVLFFGICSFTGVFGGKTTINSGTTTLGSDTSSSITVSDNSTSLAEAVSAKCLPSVVSVTVYGNDTSSSSSSIFDYLGGGNSGSNSGSSSTTQISTGSGVVISKDGYILTNQHVIEDGTGFEVTVNGKTYTATLVGSDSSSDIAVLKVEPDEELTAIELGDSDSIKTGEWVMTIGSPFGLEQSVATGIVSATSRSQIVDSSSSSTSSSSDVKIYPNMIQTDAAINPGNSGGALVNEN